MACCWYPVAYDGQPYNEGQMQSVAWWNTSGNFYVSADYFENQTIWSKEAAIGSFLSGRPVFFPSEDRRLFRGRQDPFAQVRDALGRLLFHPSGNVERVRIGHQSKAVKTFDMLRTSATGDIGATVHALYLVLPFLEEYTLSDGQTINYGWNSTLVSELLAPGRWLDVSADREWTAVDLVQNNINPIANIFIDYGLKRDQVAQDIEDNPSQPPFEFTPPEVLRQEVFIPTLTQDGGEYVQRTDIHRAFGGHRLRIDFWRRVEPFIEGSGTILQQERVPHYVIGIRHDALEAATIGDITPGPFLAQLVLGSSGFTTSTQNDTIASYHERTYPGRLTTDIGLRISGKELDLSEDINVFQELKKGFEVVQDYSPLLNFLQQLMTLYPLI